MNAIAAISQAFLKGEILTIKTAFKDFGVSNLPREVGRAIERKFNLRISKVRRESKSRYGVFVSYYEYRLNRDDPANEVGISAMTSYIEANGGFVEKRPVGRPKKELSIQEPINTHKQTPLF